MSTQCTDIERTFAREYVRDFNVTRVAASLGMSRTTAYKYLGKPHIQDMIASEMEKRATRTNLDMDRIIKELAVITQSDITDYFDNMGGRMLTMKDLNTLTPEQTRCIQSLKETISPTGSITIEIKLYDKLKAIQVVAQSLSTMIAQMREFLGMVGDTQQAGTAQLDQGSMKVIAAPGKASTLLEWEKQMKEVEEHRTQDGSTGTNIYDEPVIDAEYRHIDG